MALEIERLFLDAETGAKRCLRDRYIPPRPRPEKSGNRPAQSRQKVRLFENHMGRETYFPI